MNDYHFLVDSLFPDMNSTCDVVVSTTNITPGNYVYDLEIVTGSAVQRLIEGTATVRAEVTR